MAKWENINSRGDVQDRRGMAMAAGGLGLAGVVLTVALTLLSGGEINVNDLLTQLQDVQVQQQTTNTTEFDGQDSYEVFASTVLGSNNDMWSQVFTNMNKQYTPSKLVLFRQATESDCGVATSAVGPHYCPLDKNIYLDETFFDELKNLLGAQGGDVAEAYVISHEVGHHIQNELGILNQVYSNQTSDLAIKTELQADCFAGLWAYSIKDKAVFEQGEIEEAMDAAEAVGDDRVQEKMTGQINPETWTHGSSEQRLYWFNRGYDTGSFAVCDTFK